MYEVMVDGVAEAVHHSRSDEQRHEEIEVLRPKARKPGRLIRRRLRFRTHFLQADDSTGGCPIFSFSG